MVPIVYGEQLVLALALAGGVLLCSGRARICGNTKIYREYGR